MTKRTAKKLALEKLQFYLTQPEKHRTITFLPENLKTKVLVLHNYCPLCEMFCIESPKRGESCNGCPLICPECNSVSDKNLENNIARIKAWVI